LLRITTIIDLSAGWPRADFERSRKHRGAGASLVGQVDSVSFTGDRQRLSVSGAAAQPLLVDRSRCASHAFVQGRAPAFHLHAWFADEAFGSVITHHVPIGDFAGPHPFRGGDGRFL
jgi:hypothetical protein